MAIISCPSCSNTISDKAKTCPHCGMDFTNTTAEDIQRKANYERFKRLQSLQNQSMLAILLFVVGAYLVFMVSYGSSFWDRVLYNGALGLTALSFIWYGVNRVRIAITKRKR